METAINVIVIIFTILMAVYVEIMYRKPLAEKEVSDYQKVLDKADLNCKVKYNLTYKHDAFTELMTQRKLAKGFALVFSGIFLALTLIILAFVTSLSLLNIGIICTSGLVLMLYGIIKMAESKNFTIGVLAFVLVLGTLGRFALDELMALSPYAYFYLCGLVVLLGVFSLVPKLKKNNAKIVLLFLIASTLFTTQTWAQKNESDSKEFKKLYKQTVTKITSENRDTVEFRTFRVNDFTVTNIIYKKTHDCLCHDKLCHGPRLILTANFGKTNIFVFPNGYCFSETDHSIPGTNIVEVDIQKEKAAEAAFKKAAKETLLTYTK